MNNRYFPRFGRVAIVDDEYKDIIDVQNVLAEKGIPYVFYDYNYLITQDITKTDGIRLLFLDVNLQNGSDNEPNILTTVTSAVEQVIPHNNGPYIIILWTNKIELKDKVKDYINNNLDENESTKPSFVGALDKKDFIDEPTSKIYEAIKDYYNNEKMLAFLCDLENETMQIPSNVIKLIIYGLLNDLSNAEVEKLFLRIACNEYGEGYSKSEATRTVLRIIVELIRDRYMEIFSKEDLVDSLSCCWDFDFSNCKEVEKIRKQFNVEQDAVLNTVLNVNVHANRNENVPGRIFIHNEPDFGVDEDILVKSTFKTTPVYTDISYERKIIELDITPSCDYANNKNHMLRTIYGYAYFFDKLDDGWKEMKYSNKLEGFSSFPYVYVTPAFMINNKICVFVLNAKMLTIKDKNFSEGLEYLCRLNDDISNEIRKTVAETISRMGINTI